MAVGPVEDFLATLERSKLLKPEELAEARRIALEISDPTDLAKTLARNGLITRWQAGQLLAGRGTFFLGKYKLLELLGKGGMGSVFLGEHVMMNRRVALKIIPRHIGKDPAGLERFLAEARTIAALDHPNIVQAYSVDNEGDLYYLVMGYVEGLDLQRLVEADGPLDCATAVDYVRQAADGLAHAHTRKMVHCDIKPSNLIVNPNGVVKILDMGLARLAGHEQLEGQANEQDQRILGTVDYMAPEQALRSVDFDHRADIYSLGCTLYFLLTGHAPFPEGTLPERILKHQTQEPRPISTERSDVPLSLIDICKKMMAKRPALRYQTADEASKLLATWRPGETQVQRVMQLKMAEPIDELPGPDVLGMDLSQLFSAGEAVSATTPIKLKKTPKTFNEKVRLAILSAGYSPRTLFLAASFVCILVVSAIIGLIMIFNGTNATSTARISINESQTSVIQDTTTNNSRQKVETEKQGKQENENNAASGVTPATPLAPPAADTSAAETSPPEAPPQDTSPPQTVAQPEVQQPPQVEPRQEQQDQTPPPEEPRPEPQKIEVFKDFPKSVDLPDVPKPTSDAAGPTKTVSLGKILLPEGGNLQLVLFGGTRAIKGTDSIVLQRDASDAIWRFFVENAAEENGDQPQPKEIAQMKLRDRELLFNWIRVVTSAEAESLKQCGVAVFADDQKQFVQLCRPRQARPLLIDLDKGVTDISLPIDPSLESRNLIVQITERDPVFPPNTLNPSDMMELSAEENTNISMIFKDPKLANFKVEFTMKPKGSKLDIKATAVYELVGLQKQKTFKSLEALEADNLYSKLLNNQQSSFDKMREGSPKKADAAKKIQQLRKATELLQSLKGLYQAVNKQGKINYRIFILYGKYKVELFNSQIAPAEQTAAN